MKLLMVVATLFTHIARADHSQSGIAACIQNVTASESTLNIPPPNPFGEKAEIMREKVGNLAKWKTHILNDSKVYANAIKEYCEAMAQ
ncbi:MAG: hypothetical protein AB7F59_05740 [Bdellovibrionales bacterium]